jgi:hypothetical protein
LVEIAFNVSPSSLHPFVDAVREDVCHLNSRCDFGIAEKRSSQNVLVALPPSVLVHEVAEADGDLLISSVVDSIEEKARMVIAESLAH